MRDRRGLFRSGREQPPQRCASEFKTVLVLVLPAVQDVINVSKKYLPEMAKGFFSPKLTLHVGDGFEFMKQNQDAFDVIITDSSDPVG